VNGGDSRKHFSGLEGDAVAGCTLLHSEMMLNLAAFRVELLFCLGDI
jgi:hypothetical protein